MNSNQLPIKRTYEERERDENVAKLLLQDAVVKARVWNTCINCDSFDKDKEICTHPAHTGRPPAYIIVSGCIDYNYIPF